VYTKLAREDPRLGSARFYRKFWTKSPALLQRVLPKPKAANFDEWRACSFLLEIGPAGIPILANGLGNRSPVIRDVSAHALKVFHERGADLSKVRSRLFVALRESDGEGRKYTL